MFFTYKEITSPPSTKLQKTNHFRPPILPIYHAHLSNCEYPENTTKGKKKKLSEATHRKKKS
jgi:hypothetical protein